MEVSIVRKGLTSPRFLPHSRGRGKGENGLAASLRRARRARQKLAAKRDSVIPSRLHGRRPVHRQHASIRHNW